MKRSKKIVLSSLSIVLLLGLCAFGFKDQEHFILGTKGDTGIRRIGPAIACMSDGAVNCNGVLSQSVFLTGSAYTNATTTFSNVTGLANPVAANNNYMFICRITWQGSAGTTGPKYQFTGPGSPTAVAIGMHSVVTASTAAYASAVAFSSPVANTGTVTTATNFTDFVSLGLVNGANAGTVQLQAAANGAGTLTIQPGSTCSIF